MWRSTLTISVIFSWICTIQTHLASPIVQLDKGKLIGDVREDRKGGKYFAFQSVPYAKPPLGVLRFKAPTANEPWTGILNATTEIPKCLQRDFARPGEFIGQEDCLYLNIYTPKLPSRGRGLLPVMVFIHGGGVTSGWASIIGTGPEYLLPEGVVVVTMHYRLGILGFLSYDDDSARISANNGLKDQNLALKWIQKNVANFGGNPNLVTIFGESAGAGSVHFHMLTSKSQGLFHRVIAQSGTALDNGVEGLRNTALFLGKQLGLEGVTGAELGNKLRQLSIREIMQLQEKSNWVSAINEPWPGGPIIEPPGPDSFILSKPNSILASGNFPRVPLMLGSNDKEGLLFGLGGEKVIFEKQSPYDLTKGDPAKVSKVLERMKDHYLGGTVPEEYTDGYVDLMTDVWFREKTVEAARKHSKFGKVFLYQFSGDTKLNYFKLSSNFTAHRKGACHADELGYIFKTSPNLLVEKESIEDVSILRMVKLWTNFAKFGDPTPDKLPILRNLIWSPVRGDKLNFMNIGNSLKVGELADERLEFWKKLYKEF